MRAHVCVKCVFVVLYVCVRVLYVCVVVCPRDASVFRRQRPCTLAKGAKATNAPPPEGQPSLLQSPQVSLHLSSHGLLWWELHPPRQHPVGRRMLVGACRKMLQEGVAIAFRAGGRPRGCRGAPIASQAADPTLARTWL